MSLKTASVRVQILEMRAVYNGVTSGDGQSLLWAMDGSQAR
jgi:hypothetical protein